MKIIIPLILLLLQSCSSPIQKNYPVTGNKGIDMALNNTALSHQTKMNILRSYRGEQPVYTDKESEVYGKVSRINGYKVTTNYRPVVDSAVCNDCNYENDLFQCKEIAANNTNYVGNTLGNAAAGAGIGAALAAVTGLDVGIVAAGAATGGAIGGLGNEAITINQMIARCMQGRGYNVLR